MTNFKKSLAESNWKYLLIPPVFVIALLGWRAIGSNAMDGCCVDRDHHVHQHVHQHEHESVIKHEVKQHIKTEISSQSKTLDLDPIQSVSLSLSSDLVLTQGSQQSVRVEGPSDQIEKLSTKVEDGHWNIRLKERQRYQWKREKMTIYLTVPKLEGIRLGGSGNIKSTNSFDNADGMKISLGGSGNIDLEISTNQLNCQLSGSGNIRLAGKADQAEMRVSGSGNISASKLETDHCSARISGSGNVSVNADDQLNVSISGSGDLRYKGSPNIKKSISGSGRVRSI